jgi:hypothetical protein
VDAREAFLHLQAAMQCLCDAVEQATHLEIVLRGGAASSGGARSKLQRTRVEVDSSVRKDEVLARMQAELAAHIALVKARQKKRAEAEIERRRCGARCHHTHARLVLCCSSPMHRCMLKFWTHRTQLSCFCNRSVRSKAWRSRKRVAQAT